ncbi:hypothetical protein, partial [Vibrio sp. V18_P1S4T112]|uniref:hypothetical protein n=1 Tax=Vibrio sp. V18_P1S4T112 TaxID=1938671 RepID=UPI001C3C9541
RSYYPSECHADYFDFERSDPLQPLSIRRQRQMCIRASGNPVVYIRNRLLLNQRRFRGLLLLKFKHVTIN